MANPDWDEELGLLELEIELFLLLGLELDLLDVLATVLLELEELEVIAMELLELELLLEELLEELNWYPGRSSTTPLAMEDVTIPQKYSCPCSSCSDIALTRHRLQGCPWPPPP